MNRDQVAIIIPTYNREKFLPGAVESALSQTIACEIIVVDHGSTDRTAELAESFPKQVKYIRRERDFGPHFCWLEGALSTEAEFLKILFDDDRLHPRFVEKCLALTAPSVGFVMSRASRINRETGITDQRYFQWEGANTGVFRTESYLGLQVRNSMVSPSAMLLRRKDVIDALYQGDLPFQASSYKGVGPDHYMKLLTFLRYRSFGFVNDELVFFGAHPDSITIDAESRVESSKEIRDAYAEVTFFYRVLSLTRWIFRLRLSFKAKVSLSKAVDSGSKLKRFCLRLGLGKS